MRAVVRGVLAMIAVIATAFVGPAGVSEALVSQANRSFGPAIASVLPKAGAVVGVAHPVVVTFREPVADRAAAERFIDLTSTPAMTGTFEWLGNDVVQWIPDEFWPAHSTVALSVGRKKNSVLTFGTSTPSL